MTIITENGDAKRRFKNLLTNIVKLPPSEHYTIELRSHGSIPLILISPHGVRLAFFPQDKKYSPMTMHVTDTYRSGEQEFDIVPIPFTKMGDDGGLSFLDSIMLKYPHDDKITRILTRISVVNMVEQLKQDLLKRTPIRRHV